MEQNPMQLRLDRINSWLNENRSLIVACEKTQIVIDMAGAEVKGKVIQYPQKITY